MIGASKCDRRLRVICRPASHDRLPGKRGPGVFHSVCQGALRIRLGPAVKKHSVFAHPLLGNAKGTEFGNHIKELISLKSFQQLEKASRTFNWINELG